jgi:serine/threonine-protein kinase
MMEVSCAVQSTAPGSATRAEADVRAVLSALRDLSGPAEDGVEPPAPPRGERYTRVRSHARGGLGQVWLGRDELVGRDVAIKEPRTDRPGEAACAALEREAWFLGRLQHPNIVPLYDLVRGSDGRPAFYVMPFLGGDGLHDLADRFHRARPADPATRLTLLPLLTAFLDVCAAIEHAHGRGVWHLDIKGANVKLGPTGAAIVLDWGLARLAAPGDGEPPAGTGAAGGTPAFMAPEQAESPASRLGAHTDVYGLGALLYLLLTGRSPHPEAPRHDREELATALSLPVTPLRAHWPGVPPALEAICLKAVAAEPGERYASVAALRAEVQHWMADEPVSAYRERLPARLARWGRRHRRAATSAAAVLVTAVLALAVGLVAVDRERRETDRQRRATEAALALERDSFRQALKAGDDYFTAVSDSPLLKGPGLQPLRRELFQRGLAYYRDFLARRGDEPALAAEVASAWHRVGRIQLWIGTLPEALAAYEHALSLGEDLLAAAADADLRARLTQWYVRTAGALSRGGRFADALGHLDRAAALAGELPEEDPRRVSHMAHALNVRGDVLELSGDAAGACVAAEQSEVLYARSDLDPSARSERGTNLVRLAQLLRDRNRLAEADDAVRRAHGLFEGLHGEPGLAEISRWGMTSCDNTRGLILTATGDRAGARAQFEAARAVRRQLVEQSPTVHSYRSGLIATCMNLARLYRDGGDPRRAAEVAEEACAQGEELMRRVPSNVHFRAFALRAERLAAGDAEARGDLATAARLLARSRELLDGLGAEADPKVWRTLAREATAEGAKQLRWRHWRAALESFRQAFVCRRRADRADHRPDQRASASRQ